MCSDVSPSLKVLTGKADGRATAYMYRTIIREVELCKEDILLNIIRIRVNAGFPSMGQPGSSYLTLRGHPDGITELDLLAHCDLRQGWVELSLIHVHGKADPMLMFWYKRGPNMFETRLAIPKGMWVF